MKEKKNFKETLNLPKTEMPMRANLAQREPEILKRWDKLDIYGLLQKSNQNKDKFILHDGPPYANGRIHMGHVLNKVLKDIVLKYKMLRGYNCPYIPGWDCHGLPVEHQLFKELNISKDEISVVDFRKKAREYALKFVDIQRKGFERLGVFADWKNPYLTLNKDYESEIIKSFAELVAKGYIYKGRKPVNWCSECQTALAEAEVEYKDHTSPSVFVKFKIKPESLTQLTALNEIKHIEAIKNKDIYVLVWTTTPWTLVSNVAIALSPQLEYDFIEVEGQIWFMAKDLVDDLMAKLKITNFRVLSAINGGEKLLGLKAEHPFIERDSLILTADYVSGEEGTGCVHTAPGHGQDDYLTYLRYKNKFNELDILMPIDDKGRFDESAGEFASFNIYDANKAIISKLQANDSLILKEDILHSYPHCWRCKKPIIFRATEQWFMNIDHNNFRDSLLKTIDKDVKWIPEFGRARISAMVSNRPDWCLSRQRLWGVPVPVISCQKCQEPLLDSDLLFSIADKVRNEGLEIWFEKGADYFLDENYSCPKCKSKDFVKEDDILDVWFDSGISHQAVLRARKSLLFPADLYLEGSDQHRGWFQTSLITAMAIEEKPCYKEVLTHGFIVDGQGKKMSKSLGNALLPDDLLKTFGADILRLWVAFSDYNYDINISNEILQRVSDAYRKIRNTLRFIIGNLSDYDHKKNNLDYDQLLEIDKWALDALKQTYDECLKSFDDYDFHKVIQRIYHFCTVSMSSFYLDVLKDRLYTWAVDCRERRSAQSVLYIIAEVLTKLISPILAFTAEEVYGFLPHSEKEESVFLTSLDESLASDKWLNEDIRDNWNKMSQVRDVVLKALEEKRINKDIGNALEAKVKIATKDAEILKLLNRYKELLADIFIVSAVEIEEADKSQTIEAKDSEGIDFIVKVEKIPGTKCPRCWRYVKKLSEVDGYENVCLRCKEAINKI
jgi:isoleucyl-tRNA synthetase